MIEISNLRKYNLENVVRLETDIKFLDMSEPCPVETIYFEIDKNYLEVFADDTYDAFVLIPLFLAMKYHTDLRIKGNLSKRFYKNLTWYIQKIFCDFSPKLSTVQIIVDGVISMPPKGSLIGTGISCGVDSLSTIYDRFIKEDDPDYRINALFFFNCGANGGFQSDFEVRAFNMRYKRIRALASELYLPVIPINSNLHAFHKNYIDTMILLSNYSCVLSLQNVVRRYYTSSTLGYNEIKNMGTKYKTYDLAEFCESYLIPLIRTERTELIVDGCQYRRVDKVKKIADWDIAQKYLNVCHVYTDDLSNCGFCEKCLRTLLPLEILGKLEKFAQVFDIEKYKSESLNYKAKNVAEMDKIIFYKENVDFATENNFPMPTRRDCYVLDREVTIFE